MPLELKNKTKLMSLLVLNYFSLSLAEHTCPVLANSVDPDQLASEEANWSGSALFVIKYIWIIIKNPDQVIWLAGN